jgi:hypothetical protein
MQPEISCGNGQVDQQTGPDVDGRVGAHPFGNHLKNNLNVLTLLPN